MDDETLLGHLGLSAAEARAYLSLLEQSPLSAATIADRAGTSRSSIYLVLRSLTEKGLVEAGAGYSTRYQPAPPERALARLLEHQRTELEQREQWMRAALPRLSEMFDQRASVEGEIVEILRTPAVIAERFDRLQTETQATIDIVVRRPIQVGGPNDAELDALARGVQARAIYDRAVVDDPAVAPYFEGWIGHGEQARVFPGELPMKFSLFDGHTALMPLVAPGVSGVVVIIVRNRELGSALSYLFETLWADSTPMEHAVGTNGRPDDGHAPDPDKGAA